MAYNSYTNNNFTGGFTDNVKINNPQLSAEIDNFNILDDGSIETRDGLDIYSNDVYYSPTTEKINYFLNINEDEYFFSGRIAYKFTENNLTHILGDTLNEAIDNGTFVPSIIDKLSDYVNFSSSNWKNHSFVTHNYYPRPVKIFTNGGTPQVLTVGLPAYTQDASFTTSPGSYSYIYAFVFKRSYNIDSTYFEDYSDVHYQRIANIDEPSSSPVTISAPSFQTITNGTDYNYGLANIEIEIYRTERNGLTLYYVGSVPLNTVADFTDNVSDTDLIANKMLYTNGGIKGRSQPPRTKFIEIVHNVAFYGATEDNPYRVYYSIPNVPDGVPGDFYFEVDDEITGLSSVNKYLIVFTKNRTYRVEGSVNAAGSGSYSLFVIDSSIGSVNDNSIVKATKGIFFAGNVGFCYTDGYRVLKISENFNDTYATFIRTPERARRIMAVYDKQNKKVYWNVQRYDNSGSVNDSIFVFYERLGIKPDGVFTTWSGVNFNPVSVYIDKNNELLTTDANGILLKYSKTKRSDIVVDLTRPKEEWNSRPIMFDYTSIELNLGGKGIRKWITKIGVRIRNISDLSLQPQTATDGMLEFKDEGKIDVREQLRWGQRHREWETDERINKWENLRDAHHIRYIHKGGLRAYTKQVRFVNATIELEKSQDVCNADVSTQSLKDVQYTTDKIKILESTVIYAYADNTAQYFITDDGIYKLENNVMSTITLPQDGTVGQAYLMFKYVNTYIIITEHTTSGSIIFSTTDFVTFNRLDVPDSNIKKIVHFANKYYYIADNKLISVAEDLSSYSADIIHTDTINDIYSGQFLYIIGNGGFFRYSTDGIVYQSAVIDCCVDNINYVISINDKVIVFTDTKYYSTIDYQNWDSYDHTFDIRSIEYYDDIVVLLSNDTNGASYYSVSRDKGINFSDPVLIDSELSMYGQYFFVDSLYFYGEQSSLFRGVVASTKLVSLVDATKDFKSDYLYQFITFNDGNYMYPIIERISESAFIISNRDTDLRDGIKSWIIKGYSKEQKINILSYSLYYVPFGESFDPYTSNDEV